MKTTTVAGRTWHYSHCLGRMSAELNEGPYGSTGGFGYPMDVAVAGNDILFVISRGRGFPLVDGRPDIFARIGKTTIDEDHMADFARNEFTWPVGIAVGGDGNVYCTDEHESWIKVFGPDTTYPFPEYDPDGEYIARWGEKGSGKGQLNGPAGLEFDADDNLLVVDSLNHRVQKFTKDGRFIADWGSLGSGEGEFNRPWGITVDGSGDVYVADWGNHRVQKFSPEGRYLMSFGRTDDEAAHLRNPASVAVDSQGDVYVTDWGNNRVQIYEPNGEVLVALYGDATELSKAAQNALSRSSGEGFKIFNRNENAMSAFATLMRPVGIDIDEKDRIIITDGRGRLQVYVKDHDYVDPPA